MSDVTIRGTVTNRGIMRLWDLYLSPNIKQYTQDIKDFFATHNIAVEGEDNEVRFIGQENSLTITSDEVNNFVRQQKAKEEHLRAVALYNAALPCINTTGI